VSEFTRQHAASAQAEYLRIFGVSVTYSPFGGAPDATTGVFESRGESVDYEGAEHVVYRASLTLGPRTVDLRDTVTVDGVEWAVETVESRDGGMVVMELYRRVPRTRGTARMET